MPVTRLRDSIAAGVVLAALAVATPASGAFAADPPGDDRATIAPAAVTPGVGPVSVSIVLPLTVPPTTTGLLDAATLTEYTQVGGLLTRQLDAVEGTAVAIGLDPMVTASIRVLGTSAPAPALEFLERLRAIPNDVFLLAYADADPAVAASAGVAATLEPIGFDFALDEANFGPAATPSATPTVTPDPEPTEDPGPPPLPTTADLLAWPSTLENIAWPADGTLTAGSLTALAGLGYADVLLSAANTSSVSTALVDLGDIDGLVADEALTDAVRDASYASTPAVYQDAVTRLAAVLQDRATVAPGRTLIATLDRRWPSGGLRIADVLNAIEASSASQLVPLTDVLAGPRGGAQLVDGAEDDRAVTLGRLVEATDAESGFLSIAERADLITQPRRLALLGLSAAGWRSDESGWATASDSFFADTRATLTAVQIVEGSDQLLLSDVSSLRMQVSNALPVAVTVYLSLQPLRPSLHIEDSSVEVVVEPDSTSTVSVPVESITNGDVTVRAELRGSDGRQLGDVRFLKVILQAGWETAGTLIAGSLVVLIFGGGLVRSILRRRREAAAGGPADD